MSTSPGHAGIATKQNTPAMLRLLKARQWRWRVAEHWQLTQIVTVLTAPLLTATFGLIYPESRPWISLLAVALAIADTAWIDRCYKNALKAAAKASELFDTTLMELPWSTLTAGQRPGPEETDRAARGWDTLKDPYPVKNWYSGEVDRAPLPLARAICQRTNISYDADLRRLNRTLLDIAATAIAFVLFVLGLASSQGFAEWVLAAGVPAAPFIAWALRDRFRQADAVTSNEQVLAEAERLIDAVISGTCDAAKADASSRELQSAIFAGRARTVLLFPGLYKLRRADAEQKMHAGARYWIEKAGL